MVAATFATTLAPLRERVGVRGEIGCPTLTEGVWGDFRKLVTCYCSLTTDFMNLETTEVWLTTENPLEVSDGRAIRYFFGNLYKNRPEFHGHD